MRATVTTRRLSAAAKRMLDLAGGLLLALLALLVALPVALAILLEDGPPLFFAQERLGRNGRPFRVWKFRTMWKNADCLRAPARKGPDDPRITRVGRWLRRTSLDELPQAWSILRGEMSLVGPRPLSAAETASLGPEAWRRLAVRPGLTGLWQVSGRSDLPMERMLELDLAYVEKASLRLDCWILLRTLPAVLTGRGAY
jgi:lipopolysaccharide/colanic/teichoic acid biosynthesis glycosyltransferase